MKIAIIGRTEVLYDTAVMLAEAGHEIVCVLTAKEAPEYKRNAQDFHRLAERISVPFARGSKIIEHKNFLLAAKADIAVSINYSGIIPQEIIELFPLGILNAHGGDLPRYRGNACQAWAILNGEERVGLCIHKMIGGELDSGDIIAREYLSIDEATKIGEVLNWISVKTPPLMRQAIKQLQVNTDFRLEVQSTKPEDALRCYPRKPEDGKIDWNLSNLEIVRLINASGRPFSGAFCDFEGQKLIIWNAEMVKENTFFCAVAGQVTNICDGGVEIACGSGKILVTEVEYIGVNKRPNEIFSSIRQRVG